MDLVSILSWEEGLVLDEAVIDGNTLELRVRTAFKSGTCHLCQTHSSHIHSHYCRKIANLPLSLKETSINLKVKRFRCMNEYCSRKIFCERLGSIPVYSRRTKRMHHRLREIGISWADKQDHIWPSCSACPSVKRRCSES